MTSILTLIGSEDPAIRNPDRIVESAIALTDFEIDRQLESVSDQDRNRIGALVGHWVRGRSAESSMYIGALLLVFRATLSDASRGEQTKAMEEETGISKTQQYRCINAFKHFGRILLPNPSLAAYFVVEALKRLSEGDVTQEARDDAISAAEQGETITVAVARGLICKHQPGRSGRECDAKEASAANGQQSENALPGADMGHPVSHADRNDPGPEKRLAIETRKAAIQQLKHEEERSKAARTVLVYQDNEIRLLATPAGNKVDISQEAVLYGLQQALESSRRRNPALTIAIETTHNEAVSNV